MKRYVTKLIMLIMVSALLTGCSCSNSSNTVRLGTGNEQGTYYSYGKKLADIDSIIELKSTAGSEANLRLLDNGFIDAAIIQSDSVNVSDYRCAALTGLYTEAVQLVVREGVGINNIEDLRGKRVSVGETGSGVILNARQLLLAAGMTFNDLEAQNLSFSNSLKAFDDGEVDAFFCTAGAPTQSVASIIESNRARIMSFDDDLLRRLMNLYPGYNSCILPAGTYKGQDTEVHTVGVRAVMVVDPNMSDDEAKKLIESIFDNSEYLNKDIITDGKLNGELAVMSVGIPFHPAAADYLATQGVSVAKWTGKKNGVVFGSQDQGGV